MNLGIIVLYIGKIRDETKQQSRYITRTKLNWKSLNKFENQFFKKTIFLVFWEEIFIFFIFGFVFFYIHYIRNKNKIGDFLSKDNA